MLLFHVIFQLEVAEEALHLEVLLADP
ncbi:MAG: hypothetical protein RJB31_1615, partial [Bacteroidota bacterium]